MSTRVSDRGQYVMPRWAVMATLAVTTLAGGIVIGQQRNAGPADCAAVVGELYRTGDYRGDMRACLGEEDSPAVAIVLRAHDDDALPGPGDALYPGGFDACLDAPEGLPGGLCAGGDAPAVGDCLTITLTPEPCGGGDDVWAVTGILPMPADGDVYSACGEAVNATAVYVTGSHVVCLLESWSP